MDTWANLMERAHCCASKELNKSEKWAKRTLTDFFFKAFFVLSPFYLAAYAIAVLSHKVMFLADGIPALDLSLFILAFLALLGTALDVLIAVVKVETYWLWRSPETLRPAKVTTKTLWYVVSAIYLIWLIAEGYGLFYVSDHWLFLLGFVSAIVAVVGCGFGAIKLTAPARPVIKKCATSVFNSFK